MAEYKPVRRWAYLLGGVAIGTALGVFFARKPGEETREEFLDWLKTKRAQSKDLAVKWRDRIPFGRETDGNHNHKEGFIHA